MVVTGIDLHVSVQLVVDISLFCNGLARMDATGTVKRVPLLVVVVVIFSSPNGHQRMDVTLIG